MSQDNLLTYPFVKKEDYESLQYANKQLREKCDMLYAELESLKELFDTNLLDLNKLIEYSYRKDEKSEEVKEIRKRLKEVSSIEKLSLLTSDNIKMKIELNGKIKLIDGLNKSIIGLNDEIKKMIEAQQHKDNANKQMIFRIRNIDELMKEKLMENELLESKNKELMSLKNNLIAELTANARKLGYIGDEQKPMLVYSPRDDRFLNKKLNKIKRLLNAKFMRDKKLEKAKRMLFDVKQNIALMGDETQQHYKDTISKFDGALNG